MNHHNHHGHKISEQPKADEGVVYTCPMHPEVVQNKPGRCPLCGMNLVPAKNKKNTHEHEGHDKHAGHKTTSFLTKFWIALIFTIPLFLYSDMAMMFGVEMPRFSSVKYFEFILGSIVFFYCGWIFLASAYRELKAKMSGMMTLIALAIISAYTYSVYTVFFIDKPSLFFELSSLVAIMLLGHWIEMKSVQGAQGALKELAKLLPDTAELVEGNTTKTVSISQLKTGDIVLIKPGARIPADGKIIEGLSEINESIITGESKPVSKTVGNEVIAGSSNGDGSIKVEVTKIGEKTFLAGVMRLVAEAESSKSRLQMLSDRAAFYLTLIAVVVGVVTFISWLSVGASLPTAVERLVAVLVIACPHALGLAIPLVSAISTTMAARNGLLIKNRLALESARNIDTVLFDKTGTLTKGEFGISAIVPNSGISEDEVLKIAASINTQSEHPLAKAMVNEAHKRKIELLKVSSFERVPGKGAKGVIDGDMVLIGSESLVGDNGTFIPAEYKKKIELFSQQGKTMIHVMVGTKLIGVIALADIIREESRETIKTLKALGVKTAMITGDSEDVASWVAKELGLDEYFSRVMPEEKVNKVKELQLKGRKIAMVGDGVNDAPALTQADLGIAIGAGTNVAIESAGIILVKSDPRDIVKIFNLSRLTYSKMIQNLFWATGYNVVAIPLAAGVLAFKGIILEPAIAAVLMSVSTVVVAVNAVLMRKRQI